MAKREREAAGGGLPASWLGQREREGAGGGLLATWLRQAGPEGEGRSRGRPPEAG